MASLTSSNSSHEDLNDPIKPPALLLGPEQHGPLSSVAGGPSPNQFVSLALIVLFPRAQELSLNLPVSVLGLGPTTGHYVVLLAKFPPQQTHIHPPAWVSDQQETVAMKGYNIQRSHLLPTSHQQTHRAAQVIRPLVIFRRNFPSAIPFRTFIPVIHYAFFGFCGCGHCRIGGRRHC